MQPQPAAPAVRTRVRLTDQALVAVALARTTAAAGGRRSAHLVDLLTGLAIEPEGAAGQFLRRYPGTLALQDRAVSPRMPDVEPVLRWAADAAAPRPVSTLDLLATAVELGGAELRSFLEASSWDLRDLQGLAAASGAGTPHWDVAHRLHPSRETYGLGADGVPGLSPAAALAVGRVRAMAGGAVDLLLAAAATGEADAVLPGDEDALAQQLTMLVRQGADKAAGDRWDAGLDGVVHAARTWRAGQVVNAADLVHAAALAGGAGPAAVLDATEAACAAKWGGC